jgi:hypothetical protein
MKTISHNKVTGTLVTILGMDKRTIHHTNWPRQPSILESPQKPQLKNGKMACRFARIQL